MCHAELAPPPPPLPLSPSVRAGPFSPGTFLFFPMAQNPLSDQIDHVEALIYGKDYPAITGMVRLTDLAYDYSDVRGLVSIFLALNLCVEVIHAYGFLAADHLDADNEQDGQTDIPSTYWNVSSTQMNGLAPNQLLDQWRKTMMREAAILHYLAGVGLIHQHL